MQDKFLRLGIAMSLAIDNFAFKMRESLKKENGDTNLISVLIVLGIVIGLVVIFRNYISDILDKVKEQIDAFF